MRTSIPISEIFVSYQGEGIRLGRKTIFIRVAGCNSAMDGHACQWCDTPYSQYPEQGNEWSVEKIIEHINQLVITTEATDISITGGEPLVYIDELIELQDLTKQIKGTNIWIETNGSLPIWKSNFHWSMDIKCPSSNNAKHNRYQNLELLTERDQVKFVIASRDDFCFARDLIKMRIHGTNVVLQPAWKKLPLSTLASWMNEDKEIGHAILGTQLHKWAWPKKRRGV